MCAVIRTVYVMWLVSVKLLSLYWGEVKLKNRRTNTTTTGITIRSPISEQRSQHANTCHVLDPNTGCPRRNVPDFGRVFLMLRYTDITQNTYVQSWTVTEIMAREKCDLLAGQHTVPVSCQSYPFPSLSVVSYDGNSAHASQSAMLRHRWAFSIIVLGTLRTTMTWVRVFF